MYIIFSPPLAGLAYILCLIGLHLWWPKLTGHRFPRALALLALLLIVGGFVFTYGPQFVVGYLGMPRRYHAHPGEWHILDIIYKAGGPLVVAGHCLVACYLLWSLKYGARTGSE